MFLSIIPCPICALQNHWKVAVSHLFLLNVMSHESSDFLVTPQHAYTGTEGMLKYSSIHTQPWYQKQYTPAALSP
jgi:hypothetical protein